MSEAADLETGERVVARFQGDRRTYIKEHIMLAALGSVIMSGGLMAIGNPYPWTGVVGAVIAIAARGFYVADEQLGMVWTLTNRNLIGPSGAKIPLSRIKVVKTIFSAAQVVTVTGDKYLVKYQADPKALEHAISSARGT